MKRPHRTGVQLQAGTGGRLITALVNPILVRTIRNVKVKTCIQKFLTKDALQR